MKFRYLSMVSSLLIVSGSFLLMPVEQAKSQEVQCDEYGRCYEIPSSNSYDDESQRRCDEAAGGGDIALLSAYGIDCTRYGYPQSLNDAIEAKAEQLRNIH